MSGLFLLGQPSDSNRKNNEINNWMLFEEIKWEGLRNGMGGRGGVILFS